MTKEQYERWSLPFRKGKNSIRLLVGADRVITVFVFLSYPALLLYLILQGSFLKLIYCILVPGASFLLVSLFRKLYSAPRPYEMLGIQPLIEKKTKGKSFPSRHVFSAFIIAMTFVYVIPLLGCIFGVLGAILAYIRVAEGVHFPRDVAVGAVLGILFGLFYFLI